MARRWRFVFGKLQIERSDGETHGPIRKPNHDNVQPARSGLAALQLPLPVGHIRVFTFYQFMPREIERPISHHSVGYSEVGPPSQPDVRPASLVDDIMDFGGRWAGAEDDFLDWRIHW